MLEEILASTLRMALPLVLVAMSGLLSERSGVANIALEAQLTFAAFTAATLTSLSGLPALAIISGIGGAVVVAAVFSYFSISGKGDDIVVGIATNILVMGLTPTLTKTLFSVTGSTPSLDSELRLSWYLFAALGVGCIPFMYFIFKKTAWGLRVNAAGENPDALESQGVSAKKIRYQAVIYGSVFAGIAGAYLSVCQSSGFVRNMAAGRGYMALAALILGGWKPIPTLLACLVFALFDALQMRLQEISFIESLMLPHQLIQALPFIITLLGLVMFGGKMKTPRAINKKLQSS